MPASDEFFRVLQQHLARPLPGRDVQYRMASAFRRNELPDYEQLTDYRESAVCIALFERDGQIVFILIERPVYEGVHSGQIALPGGKKDPTDPDLMFTALRELYEETGIRLLPEDVLGSLSRLYIPPSNFMVYPYVAVLRSIPVYQPDEREVKQVLEVSIDELMDETIIKETEIEVAPGMKIKTPYFEVQGKVVWGATAMMLNELKYIIASFRSR
jgi:8-oxo-dGTP pyrophosphatase MutT (NUDIX family)